MIYGIIEWQFSGNDPKLLAGLTKSAVRRAAFDTFSKLESSEFTDCPSLFEDFPPDLVKTDQDVEEWLETMRDCTTVPWFSIYTEQDITWALPGEETKTDG